MTEMLQFYCVKCIIIILHLSNGVVYLSCPCSCAPYVRCVLCEHFDDRWEGLEEFPFKFPMTVANGKLVINISRIPRPVTRWQTRWFWLCHSCIFHFSTMTYPAYGVFMSQLIRYSIVSLAFRTSVTETEYYHGSSFTRLIHMCSRCSVCHST